MAFTWDMTIDDSTDWTHVEFLRMFWRAVRERLIAVGGTDLLQSNTWLNEPPDLPASQLDTSIVYPYIGLAVGGGGTISAITKPDGSIEYHRFGSGIINYLQNSLCNQSILNRYLNPQKSFLGTSHSSEKIVFGQSAGWDDYYGLGRPDSNNAYNNSPFAVYAVAGLNPAGFTRKYPRELFINQGAQNPTTFTYITSSGSSASIYASISKPSEIGQKARIVGFPSGYPQFGGRIAVYDGSTWILAEEYLPDTIIDYGFCTIGDYLGPWLFNELRSVLNVMTKSVTSASAVNAGVLYRDRWAGSTASTPEASYNEASYFQQPFSNIYSPAIAKSISVTSYSAGSFSSVSGIDFMAMNVARHSNAANPSSMLYQYIPSSHTIVHVLFGPHSSSASFSNLGDTTILNNQWQDWFSFDTAAGAQSTPIVFQPPSMGKIPASYLPAVNTTIGYAMIAHCMVNDWAVPGGFQYVAST